MNFPWKVILRASLIGTLYALAAPVYIVLGAASLHRLVEAFAIVSSGVLTCIHCGHDNVLNRLATCNRCRATEYGSLLYCSFCGQISRYLPCGECGVTLRVLPGAGAK